MSDKTIDYSKHLQKSKYSCKFEMNDNYKFINNNIFFKIFSFLFYVFVVIFLYPFTLVYYGLKVKGRKNIKKIKNAVFVSNHILGLDFASIICHILCFKRPYTLTLTDSFKVPFARKIIRLLRAVPLPNDFKSSKNFIKQVDMMINDGGSLLVFPESSMWKYYNEIRPFKNGSFRFAIKGNVPIVPIVITLRKPNKFYKILGKKKPLVTLNILEPIFPNNEMNIKDSEKELNKKCYDVMSDFLHKNSDANGYVDKNVYEYLKSFDV